MSVHTGQAHPSQGRHEIPGEVVGGVVLTIIGLFMLAAFAVPEVGLVTALAVGLVLLAAFVITREYGLGIAAGIVTGVGIGVLAVTRFTGEAAGSVMLLALAGGFAAAWLLGFFADPARRHPWPLIPAGILAVIGLALALGQAEMLAYLNVVGAAALIVAGAALMVGWYRRRRA